MERTSANLFHKAPAVRLFTAMAAGIITAQFTALSLPSLLLGLIITSIGFFLYQLCSLPYKYRFRVVGGLCLWFCIFITGAIILYLATITHQKHWVGNYRGQTACVVTIQEPLVEKPATYKALGKITGVILKDSFDEACGGVIVYFKKKGKKPAVGLGSRILIKNILEPIKNTGNPGSFDYREYCLRQGVTHQAYLDAKDYIILSDGNGNAFQRFVFHCRTSIVSILRSTIKDPKESGMAEALLIGYKDDLDKTLVQSYTNAGVIHVIAISGMHLALIYSLLMWLTSFIARMPGFRLLRVVIIIGGIWLFAILSGLQPSILRSALIFTCLALSDLLSRRTNAINSLSLSAFILLCFNPFWLWDVGFQLSYAAVLSILIFLRPISSLYYFNNKILKWVWSTICVCLAAQILTLPLCLYHFHQLPILFLLTNLVAVPLSGFIVLAEIILCLVWGLPLIGGAAGLFTLHAIRFLDNYIERFASLSFATWDHISISLLQALLLMVTITGLSQCLILGKSKGVWLGLLSLLVMILLRGASFVAASHQLTLIVYNVPRQRAAEIVSGTRSFFLGRTDAFSDPVFYKQILLPSHTLLRINDREKPTVLPDAVVVNGKKIVVMDSTAALDQVIAHGKIDVLILSGRPQCRLDTLPEHCDIKFAVIDASVPFRASRQWKERFHHMHISYTDIREDGAFQINL